MKENTPFQVGGLVSGPYFIGRNKELGELKQGLETFSQNYLIIAPRRVGKSSLLYQVKRELEQQKTLLVVYLNCREISSKKNLVTKIISSLLDEYEKKYKVKGLLESFKLTFKGKIFEALRRIEEVGGKVSELGKVYLRFREGELNEEELLEKALVFPETFAQEKKIKIIFLFDEFQKLSEINGQLFEFFKSKIDLQKEVRYAISGSSISMLNKIFLKKESPLYMMFTKIYLNPLDEKITKDFVKKRLAKFGIKITEEALNLIYQYTGGIPYYVQKLGYRCFEETRLHNKLVNEKVIDDSFDRMLKEFDEEFESRFEYKFTPKRQAILKEMSKVAHARISEVAKALEVDINFLGESFHFLVASMVIKREKKGYYDFFDPVFKLWLREYL